MVAYKIFIISKIRNGFLYPSKIYYHKNSEKGKCIWQELAKGSQFAYDPEGRFYVTNTAYILTGKHLKYILGVLNSKLIEYAYRHWYCTTLGKKGTRWLYQHIMKIPIPKVNINDGDVIEKIVSLVEKIIILDRDKTIDKMNIAREIDLLVCKLYRLNTKEISLVYNNLLTY